MVTAKTIARAAVLGALLLAAQLALSFLPNVEIITLLILIFTKNLGREGTLASLIYVCLTALIWGFGLWWFTYFVVWGGFSEIVFRFRRLDSFVLWAVVCGFFGLIFGAVFAVPYIFVSPSYALSYWIAGIPWDITHCISNIIIVLVLGKPLDTAFKKTVKRLKQKGQP